MCVCEKERERGSFLQVWGSNYISQKSLFLTCHPKCHRSTSPCTGVNSALCTLTVCHFVFLFFFNFLSEKFANRPAKSLAVLILSWNLSRAVTVLAGGELATPGLSCCEEGLKENMFSLVKRVCEILVFGRVLQLKMCRRKIASYNMSYTVLRHCWMKSVPVISSSSFKKMSSQADKVTSKQTC